METFEIEVHISRDVSTVLAAFWHLEEWPAVAPHVRKIDIIYSDPQVQVLLMTVHSRGRADTFKTVRILQGNSIFYYQPEPPSFLLRHYGFWELASDGDGTVITSRHMTEFDVEAAHRYLAATGAPSSSDDDAKRLLIDLIRNNSLQTMRGLKRRMEQQSSEVAHALP